MNDAKLSFQNVRTVVENSRNYWKARAETAEAQLKHITSAVTARPTCDQGRRAIALRQDWISAEERDFMSDSSIENMVSLVSRAMPNADQISWLSFGGREVRFSWRGATFRVDVQTEYTEEVDGHMLVGSDKAILIQQLIRKQRVMEAS